MTGDLRPGMVKCPHCQVDVKATRLENHILRMHHTAIWRMEARQGTAPKASSNTPRQDNLETDEVGECPVCGKVMWVRYLDDHAILHKTAGDLPKPKIPPVQHPQQSGISSSGSLKGRRAIPKSKNQLRNRPRPDTESSQPGNWYRDSEGELAFGVTSESEQHNGNTDVDIRKNRGAQPHTEEESPKSIIPNPITENLPLPIIHRHQLFTCPICQTQFPKDMIRTHMHEHPGVIDCPACESIMKEEDFIYHMGFHLNWCPICRREVLGLMYHFKHAHQVTLLGKMWQFYRPNWETEQRFLCDQCQEKISITDYPRHQKPHMPVRKPERPDENNQAATNPDHIPLLSRTYMKPCPICQKEILPTYMKFHLSYEHPVCPYCQAQFTREDLKTHIGEHHPEHVSKK